MKKRILASILGVSLLLFSGCLGPNRLTHKLNNWNAEATEQQWLNEAIFVPLTPVYLVTLLGDWIIFNSMDFWGDNPIDDPGAYPGK